MTVTDVKDRISIEIGEDGVADVRLNRPDKMNAIDPPMFEALREAGQLLSRTPGVRAVVLSGEGRAFSAGLDMASMQGLADAGSGSGERRRSEEADVLKRDSDSPANAAQQGALVWQDLPAPVIAAVHGVAYGAGCQIALGADIRFIAPDARMAVMEIKWGLIPDMGITQTLRHVGRLDVAKELTYTGRVVNGTEAVELGLATHVSDDPRAAALELAREIASKSPDAVRAAKKLLNTAQVGTPREGLQLEEKLQRQLIGSSNQAEAVKANFEKRDPKFRDPE